MASEGTYVALRTINAALSAAQEVEQGAYLDDVPGGSRSTRLRASGARAEAVEKFVRGRPDEVGSRNGRRVPRFRSAGRGLNPAKSEQRATSQFSRIRPKMRRIMRSPAGYALARAKNCRR